MEKLTIRLNITTVSSCISKYGRIKIPGVFQNNVQVYYILLLLWHSFKMLATCLTIPFSASIHSVKNMAIRTRWSIGCAFDDSSRGPLVESYPGLTWISLCTRNESQRFHATNAWIGSVCESLGSVCWLHTNREWKNPQGGPKARFLI